jgi:hypothetical protein
MIISDKDSKNKKILISSILILILSIGVRFMLAISSYGGGDTTNGISFIDLHNSGYDIYSVNSPWPYFPFANSLLLFWDMIANFLNIDLNLSYRLTSSFFDACIALLIYYYLLVKNSPNAFKYAVIYALNPVTIIIVATLGFTDSLALLLLMMAIVAYELKIVNNKDIITAFFLTASVSIKPIALLFYPYFIYKSHNKLMFTITSIAVGLLLNSYYLLGASFESIFEVLALILGKVTTGHQLGPLGIGSFSEIIGFDLVKAITVVGVVLMPLIYLLKINSRPAEFVLFLFIFLLLFRYNFHPQYLAWIVPFALMTERKVYPYIVISALSLLVINFDWQSSTGSLALLSSYGIDAENSNSSLASMYTLLNSPLILGAMLLSSMLFIITKQDLVELKNNATRIVKSLPRLHMAHLMLILVLSFLLGVIYTLLSIDVNNMKLGVYMRVLVLIVIPSLIILYLYFINIVYRKNYIYKLVLFLYISMCFVSFIFFKDNMQQIYNISTIYGLILGAVSIFILFRQGGILHDALGINDLNNKYQEPTKILRLSIYIFIFFIVFLLISTWSALYNAAQNKFSYYKGQATYEEIKINPPKMGFVYGDSFEYVAAINIDKIVDRRKINKVFIKILSDSYYMLSINDTLIHVNYSPLYYMRHATKRKGYYNDVEVLDITQILDNKFSRISIIDNISATVKPIGISGMLIILKDDGTEFVIPLDRFEWNLTKGKFNNGAYVEKSKEVKIDLIKVSDIDEKYSIFKNDLLNLTGKGVAFLSPVYKENYIGSRLTPIDIFFLLYIVLVLLIGSILKNKS